MPIASQDSRHIAIETPLGKDVLLLQSFSGHEEISRLFEFDLHLLSEDYQINSDDIIGQNVTIRMDLSGGGTRYWNGHIVRFTKSASSSQRFAQYRATMVPWLWFLTRTSDCRIFQEKTVPDIIKQVFSDLGFTDVEERLSGSYGTWTYCVQYRETDFNFVSRLMEQEGIYYYFLHEDGKCTIVLSDSRSMHDSYGDYDEIGFDSRASSDQERIREWTVEKQLQAGKVSHTDYNFKKPATSLMSLESESWGYTKGEFEIYDAPGEFLEKPDGEHYAKVRMEELVRSYEECVGEADSRGICPGYLFTLTVRDNSDLSMSDQTREYLVVSVNHQATSEAYETSDGEGPGGAGDSYSCFFTVIPSSIQFRPLRKTPKPVVEGSQTAIVTGPSGEEIYTDEHGRVKVQFHWDREGKRDQNSSCWIRVSQAWAGAGWGAMIIPRIGHEVIVSFIEGDPDRPIITGRVYHGTNTPPYDLPGEKTKSTLKSNSSKGGGGFNEFRFEDKKGEEEVFLHGQKDWTIEIENNKIQTVGANENSTIGNDRTKRVNRNQSETIVVDKTIKVGANHTETIGAMMTQTVAANKVETVGANKSETITTAKALTIGAAYQVSVGGAMNVTVGGVKGEEVGGAKIVAVGDTHTVSVGKKQSTTVGKEYSLNAKIVRIEAKDEISLKAGGAQITLKKSGDIQLKGKKIEIKASGDVTIKGSKIQQN
jgi:type VI secretion system secreted protein VgrG